MSVALLWPCVQPLVDLRRRLSHDSLPAQRMPTKRKRGSDLVRLVQEAQSFVERGGVPRLVSYPRVLRGSIYTVYPSREAASTARSKADFASNRHRIARCEGRLALAKCLTVHICDDVVLQILRLTQWSRGSRLHL